MKKVLIICFAGVILTAGVIAAVMFNSSISSGKLDGQWQLVDEIADDWKVISTFTFDGDSFTLEMEHFSPATVNLGFESLTETMKGTFSLNGNYLTGHQIELNYLETVGKTIVDYVVEISGNDDYYEREFVEKTEFHSISVKGDTLTFYYGRVADQRYTRISSRP